MPGVFFWSFTLVLVIVGGFYFTFPHASRRGLLFGVYVGEAASKGEEAHRITRSWYLGMSAWLAAGVLPAFVGTRIYRSFLASSIGAFTRTPFLLGQEVAMLEADTAIGIITANGNLADGAALFEKDTHKNYIDSAAAISIEALGAARVKLMTQKSTGGKPLNITPKFLLVPAAIGTVAEQYCSPNYQAVTAASVNPLAGRLTPIIEARLDASDANDWYLFGDPNSPNGTVLIYAYLEGQEGRYTESRQGFDVDGVEIKIRHDFAAGAAEYQWIRRTSWCVGFCAPQ